MPGQVNVGGLRAFHFADHFLCDRGFGLKGIGHHRLGSHGAKVPFDLNNYFIGIKVSAHDNGHVVGHIVAVVIFVDLQHRRVFEMLNGANGGLGAVGVVFKEPFKHGFPHFIVILVQPAVLFFIHGFQLGVEEPQNGLAKALGLNFQPVAYLVAGNVVHINGLVKGGKGVGAVGADGSQHFVVLIGNGVFSRHAADAVYLVIDLAALRFIRVVAVGFVKRFYFGDLNAFFFKVLGAIHVGALKHHVLQVVGQARGVGRIVLAAGFHANVGLYARRVFIYGKINLHPVP